MSSITVSNCIRFYEVAEEIDASVLRDHCSNLISAHWTDFTAKDFAAMGAPLLFKMFKVRNGDGYWLWGERALETPEAERLPEVYGSPSAS